MPANLSFADLTLTQRLSIAAKPRAWPKVFLPWVIGIAFAVQAHVELRPLPILASFGYALFGVLFILFVNDWADQAVDALRRQMLPSSSPKTIADGVLSARTVLWLGLASLGLALGCAALASWLVGEPSVWWLGLFGTLLFAAYSLPPLRINDRGGGEVLEATGIALVVPLFTLHAQVSFERLRDIVQHPLCGGFLAGFFLFALAGAIASGLADETSDRLGGKRTWVVIVGNRAARRSIEALVLGGGALWFAFGVVFSWQLLLVAAVACVAFAQLQRRSPHAMRHDAPQMAAYKDALRQGLGRSIAVYSMSVFLSVWVPT